MTEYKPYTVSLSGNQKLKLSKAIVGGTPLTLRLGSADLSGSDKIFLTKTQINKIKKSKSHNKGVDINISKTQISKVRSMTGLGLQNRPPTPIKKGHPHKTRRSKNCLE